MEGKSIKSYPALGDVYLVNFSGIGSTQHGLRPAVVFQNNRGNRFSPNVTVLPMTSSIKKVRQDTHVVVPADGTGLIRDSMVLCENPVCIPKSELGAYLTTLPGSYIGKIAVASMLASSAVSFLDASAISSVLNRAAELNTPAC